MALLGAQLVITLVVLSIMQKIGSYYSLARWLLCSTGLERYLYPTNEELRTLSRQEKEKVKQKNKSKNHEHNGKIDEFKVPRNLDINLQTTKISPLDVIHLRYYTEYQWLVDFSLYSAIVYMITEIYTAFFPLKDETNLSMMWCLLVLGFSIKMLIKITLQYFRGEESIGERSTCLVAGGIHLLIAMMVLIVDENTLEVGLDKAYVSFNSSASIYLANQGITTSGPASKLILKFCFAVWCGVLGSLFTFPGLRLGRMHSDSLKYYGESKICQILLNVSFALPFVLILLWIKPITKDYLTVRVFSGMEGPLMTESAFNTLRLVLVILTVVLRFTLMPIYLQAYLNVAYRRIEELKKEAGHISNIDLQRKVAAVFQYLCVVSLQYVTPIILCLYLTLMYKTLGGYSWRGLFNSNSLIFLRQSNSGAMDECPINSLMSGSHGECSLDNQNVEDSDYTDPTILQSAQNFQLAVENFKNIFTIDVFRGIFGFATWWTCFTLFATSSMGMVYEAYFTKS